MEKINGGVTAAKGFLAASAAAGIKYENRQDMALVFSQVPAVSAGVFTTNVVKAAPVKWDMDLVNTEETAQAVVLNSGIANACTGKTGDTANFEMAKAIARELKISPRSVLTASTGVIGMHLPIDKLQNGAKLLASNLSESLQAGEDAAKAIMTTDTIKKECAVTFELSGVTCTLGGMTKGSGMIHPNMATMLCVLTTDVAISKELLVEALKEDVADSFNMISVDRDTSTNDTYVILANAMANNPIINTKNEDYEIFCQALSKVSVELAKLMAADGEGATKLFEATVINCDTKENAAVLAKSIITSNLVKTAVYGNDANMGRVICAMGYSGVKFDPEVVDLSIQSQEGTLNLFENGMITDFSEELATKILSAKEVSAIANMKTGTKTATAWGCDLTYDYIKINADYRS